MKIFLKKTLKILFYRLLNRTQLITNSQVSQVVLMNQYRELLRLNQLPSFQDTGLHVYSQTDEDGYLLYIFSLIGTTNKKVVEIGAGDGLECNSANLIINHRWQGLLLDGDKNNTKTGTKIYGFLKATRIAPPRLVNAWITAENINELIEKHDFSGEVDLLSIDIDGNDYWIWKAIKVTNPRVVIVEYNGYWVNDDAVTIPYDPKFELKLVDGVYYCGASLAAFVTLGKQLGYRLVGSNTNQFNAFFVRNDIGLDCLPEVTAASCLSRHQNETFQTQNNAPKVSKLPWVRV